MSPRERVRRVRQTVAALTAAAFLALFAGIYAQMASGHDPALGASAVQTVTSDSGSTSSSASTTSNSNSGSDSGSASSEGSGSDYQPASVATGQS
jgi:hypothetical protein